MPVVSSVVYIGRKWDSLAAVVTHMTDSFEEMLKKHTYRIRCMAFRTSRGFGGVQQVDDLEAVGNAALWQCYQRFDTDRLPETDFWAYAQRRVLGAMMDALRKQDSVSRWGRLMLKANEVDRTPWATIHPVSLSAAKDVPSSSDPHSDLVTKCDCELARKLVSALSYRHQCVIHMYFVEEMRLIDIGARLGISESRVSQIKIEALSFLSAWAKDN